MAEEAKPKKGRSLTNVSSNPLVFGLTRCGIGETVVLSDDDVKNENTMFRIKRAGELGLVKLV